MTGLATVATGSILTEGMKQAFLDGVTAIVGGVQEMVSVALPPALIIAGIFITIGLGMKFFKSVTH